MNKLKASIRILLFLLGILPVMLSGQDLVINEFLASNSSVNADPDFGDYADWIELYNRGVETINLGAFFVTDNLADSAKWSFPDGVVLAPGEFLILWADSKDTVLAAYHSNFKLSSRGEEIAVFDSTGILLDSVVFQDQTQNFSFGRQPDGGADWYSFDVPTPGASNTQEVYLQAGDPQFSLPAGFYSEDQLLELWTGDSQSVIHYTLNGDEPTLSSPVYTDPIPLASRVGEANVFSEIRTTKDPYLWLPDWIPPAGEVFKANVIRARAFRDGSNPSNIITRSYLVDGSMVQRYSGIAVISINSDSKHLFDHHSGIYVPGVSHQSGNSGSGNYFQDWEKPAHIEFFEPGGELGFSQDVGISIQGGTSPASPQKGLHVIARGSYGKNRIEYPLFQDDPSSARELFEFKRFIIRAWGSLITGSLFNDAYAHRLMAQNDLDIQAYRPAVVFINGEYWGLHALREASKNSWYYQYHHGIDRENPGYDILLHSERNGAPFAYIDEGDADHWNAMMNFIRSKDMNLDENFSYLSTQMDMENFVAYMGHCIYLGKWDWPNNNDASWRPRTADGKWRWIQFDMETGFGVATGLGPEYSGLGPQLNMFDAAIKGIHIPNFGTYGPHPILAEIYQNEDFREAFIDWFLEKLDHEFHPDTMNQVLDEMAAEIRPYMEEYHHRWPFIGNVRGSWESALDMIREFNDQRQNYVKAQLLELYQTEKIIPEEYQLMQNYPNPFVTSTSIAYRIPEAGEVSLKVFDSRGQLIYSISKQHDAAGQYTLTFDVANQAAGIYYYTFEGGGYYDVKKMMLLR